MTCRVAITMTYLLLASVAAAQDCPPDAVGCHSEDVDFQHRDALFNDVEFDTGWVPGGGPLQVRFGVFLAGSTQVDMGGTSVTTWPPPLAQALIGRPETGRLAINYGLEIIARIRFDVRVAGIRYMWEGDIPIPGGVPADLRIADDVVFDPFLLPPETMAVSVMDATGAVPVVTAAITDSLIPIPGISGGFTLTATAELAAAYLTRRVVVGDAVDAIEMEGASVVVRADEGADGLGEAKDVSLTPEGVVSYDGAITLTPSLSISIAGSRFDLPIADIPIPLGPLDTNTDFNTAEVHVPLPDIAVDPTALEFDATAVGDSRELLLTVNNRGEATLEVEVRTPAAPFGAGASTLTIPPSSTQRLAITFSPFTGGDRDAVLFLATNDPDAPLVTVQLNGSGLGVRDGGVTGDGGAGPVTDGGCGCRVTSVGSPTGARWLSGPPSLALLALGLVALRRARRRRR